MSSQPFCQNAVPFFPQGPLSAPQVAALFHECGRAGALRGELLRAQAELCAARVVSERTLRVLATSEETNQHLAGELRSAKQKYQHVAEVLRKTAEMNQQLAEELRRAEQKTADSELAASVLRARVEDQVEKKKAAREETAEVQQELQEEIEELKRDLDRESESHQVTRAAKDELDGKMESLRELRELDVLSRADAKAAKDMRAKLGEHTSGRVRKNAARPDFPLGALGEMVVQTQRRSSARICELTAELAGLRKISEHSENAAEAYRMELSALRLKMVDDTVELNRRHMTQLDEERNNMAAAHQSICDVLREVSIEKEALRQRLQEVSEQELRNLKNLTELTELAECVVCMEARRSIVLRPCNHYILCQGCRDQDSCPICNCRVDGTIRVFQS